MKILINKILSKLLKKHISKVIDYLYLLENINLVKRKTKSLKYLHIMHNDKFNKDIIDMINTNFDSKENIFLFYGGYSQDVIKIPDYSNLIKISDIKILECIDFSKVKKIFLHGLFEHKVINFLNFNQKLLLKCYWLIWGGDLYDFRTNESLQQDSRYFIKKNVISKIPHVVTCIKGEFDLVKEYYECSAKQHCLVTYPSNSFQKFNISKTTKQKEKFSILLNHSASSNSMHIDLLNILNEYKNKIDKVICPLSYSGDEHYVNNVICFGKKLFGENFIPITKLIDKKEYFEILLNEIDIAVFGHKTQQGFGNIITLLSMGKKVYIEKSSAISSLFEELNINFNYTHELKDKSHNLLELEKSLVDQNLKILENIFSSNEIIKSWKNLLSE